jgi:hypothetical protein
MYPFVILFKRNLLKMYDSPNQYCSLNQQTSVENERNNFYVNYSELVY